MAVTNITRGYHTVALDGRYRLPDCRHYGSFAHKSLTAGGGRLAFPTKVALKEFPCPALALFAEHNRLRFRPRVGDVPLGMETFHRLPIVRLPRSPWTRRCQLQQCQNHLVHFVVVVFHRRSPGTILHSSFPPRNSSPGLHPFRRKWAQSQSDH